MFLHAWIVHQLLARVYFEGFVVFTWTLDLCKNWMLDIYEISFTMCNPNSLCSFTESNYIVIWLLVFGFVGSAWSFGFFIPATTVNDLRPQRIFYPRFYPLHLFSYLNSWERASIFFWMFSAKQGNYWYHLYNVFVMKRSLTGDWTRDLPHSKPALYH